MGGAIGRVALAGWLPFQAFGAWHKAGDEMDTGAASAES